MVDGISWNPFTQKALTAEEIQQLDTDKDGVVSQGEFDAGMSWLAGGGQDADGEVAITEGDELLGNAVANGMKTSVSTEADFKQQMTLLKDQFIEQYLNSNTAFTDAERNAAVNLINNATNTFIEQELAKKSETFDMTAISAAYQTFVNSAIEANNAALRHVNNQVDGYTNNMDTSYDAMVTSASLASENNYITTAEWGKVRNSTVSYLMGALMNSEDISALLNCIDPKYSKNTYYQDAVKAINELKSCNDPAKMQELLTKAQTSLTNFLNSVGGVKVVDAIGDAHKAKEEAAISQELNKVVDVWVEEQCSIAQSTLVSGTTLGADKIAELNNFAQTTIGKFLAKLAEEDRLDSDQMKALVAEFKTYITTQFTEFQAVKDDLVVKEGEIDTAYNATIKASDSAKENGNISVEEKAAIVAAGTELIYQQLLSNAAVIPLLLGLNSSYPSTSEFKEIQSLITKIQTSTDFEEIKKLQDQVKGLISAMLDKYSGQQLTDAVDRTKPVEIDAETKDKALYNSAIGNDYNAGVSRSTSRGKQNGDRLKEIQEMAKKDIAAYAEGLKTQLKSKLGAGFDEAAIDAIIASATNDTISFFTQNIVRKNQHGDYSTGTDNYRFVFADRSGTSKGRYCYNVKALIDKFTEFFNSAAKVYNAEKNDPSKITYDKQDVIAASLGNEYDRDESIKTNDNSSIRATAKSKLMSVAAQIQAQLAAKGCQVPSSVIAILLDESIAETLDTFNFGTQSYKEFLAQIGSADTYSAQVLYKLQLNRFSVKKLVDTFLQIFDAKFEKAKGKEDEDKKPEEEKPL